MLNQLQNDYRQLSNECKKKNPIIVEQCESAIVKIKELDNQESLKNAGDYLVLPFLNACESHQDNLISIGLHGIQKLIRNNLINENNSRQIITTVEKLAKDNIEQIRILQTIILLINSTDFIHSSYLSMALSICFNLNFKNYLKSVTAITKIKDYDMISRTSGAAIQQILACLLDKIFQKRNGDVPNEIIINDLSHILKDLCSMSIEDKTDWLIDVPTIKPEFILELILDLLEKYPLFFKKVPAGIRLLKDYVCPYVIKLCTLHPRNNRIKIISLKSIDDRTTNSSSTFAQTMITALRDSFDHGGPTTNSNKVSRRAGLESELDNNISADIVNGTTSPSSLLKSVLLLKIIFVLLNKYHEVLIMECEIFVALISKLSEIDDPNWFRPLALETIHKILDVPALLKYFFMTYDLSEDSSKLYEILIQTLESNARLEIMEKKSSSTKETKTKIEKSRNPEISSNDIDSIPKGKMKLIYLETNVEKLEAKSGLKLPDNYTFDLLFSCITSLIHSLKILVTDGDAPRRTYEQMLQVTWIEILFLLNTFIEHATFSAHIDELTGEFVNMILLCHTIGLGDAIKAYVTTLCKNALPTDYPGVQRILAYANNSSNSDSTNAQVSGTHQQPTFSQPSGKNVHCFLAILNLIRNHGESCDAVWLILLATINHVIRLLGIQIEVSIETNRLNLITGSIPINNQTIISNSNRQLNDEAASSKLLVNTRINEQFKLGDVKNAVFNLFENSNTYETEAVNKLFEALMHLFLENMNTIKNNPKATILAYFPIYQIFYVLQRNAHRSDLLWHPVVQQFLVDYVILRKYDAKLGKTTTNLDNNDSGSDNINYNSNNNGPTILAATETSENYKSKSLETSVREFTDKRLLILIQFMINQIIHQRFKSNNTHVVKLKEVIKTLVNMVSACPNNGPEWYAIKLAHLTALISTLREYGIKLFVPLLNECNTTDTTNSSAITFTSSSNVTDIFNALSSIPNNSASKTDLSEPETTLYNQCLSTGFQCLQIFVNDLLPASHQNIASLDFMIESLLGVIFNYASQRSQLNISLTSIALMWNLSDYFNTIFGGVSSVSPAQLFNEVVISGSKYLETWLNLYTKMSHTCLDPRPTVRKSGCQTLFSTLETQHRGNFIHLTDFVRYEILWKVILPLAERIRLNCYEFYVKESNIGRNTRKIESSGLQSTASSNQETSSSSGTGGNEVIDRPKLLIHHSRDTEFKQWSETLALTIDSITRILVNSYVPHTHSEYLSMWSWILEYAVRCLDIESNEIIVSVLKFAREILDIKFHLEEGIGAASKPEESSLTVSNNWTDCYIKLWITYLQFLRLLIDIYEQSIPTLMENMDFKSLALTGSNALPKLPDVNFANASPSSTNSTQRFAQNIPPSPLPLSTSHLNSLLRPSQKFNNALTMFQLIPMFLHNIVTYLDQNPNEKPALTKFNKLYSAILSPDKSTNNSIPDLFELFDKIITLPIPKECFNSSFLLNVPSIPINYEASSPTPTAIEIYDRLTQKLDHILSTLPLAGQESKFFDKFFENQPNAVSVLTMDTKLNVPATLTNMIITIWYLLKIFLSISIENSDNKASNSNEQEQIDFPTKLTRLIHNVTNAGTVGKHFGKQDISISNTMALFDPTRTTLSDVPSNIVWLFVKSEVTVAFCYQLLLAVFRKKTEYPTRFPTLKGHIFSNLNAIFSEKFERDNFTLESCWDILFVILYTSQLSQNLLAPVLSIFQRLVLDEKYITALPLPPSLVLKYLNTPEKSDLCKQPSSSIKNPLDYDLTQFSSYPKTENFIKSNFGKLDSPISPTPNDSLLHHDVRQKLQFLNRLKINTVKAMICDILVDKRKPGQGGALKSDFDKLFYVPVGCSTDLTTNQKTSISTVVEEKCYFGYILYDILIRGVTHAISSNQDTYMANSFKNTISPAILATNSCPNTSDEVRSAFLDVIFKLSKISPNSLLAKDRPSLNISENLLPLFIVMSEVKCTLSNYQKESEIWSKLPLPRAKTQEITTTLKIFASILTFIQKNDTLNLSDVQPIWNLVLEIYDILVLCMLSNSRQICSELQNTFKLYRQFLRHPLKNATTI